MPYPDLRGGWRKVIASQGPSYGGWYNAGQEKEAWPQAPFQYLQTPGTVENFHRSLRPLLLYLEHSYSFCCVVKMGRVDDIKRLLEKVWPAIQLLNCNNMVISSTSHSAGMEGFGFGSHFFLSGVRSLGEECKKDSTVRSRRKYFRVQGQREGQVGVVCRWQTRVHALLGRNFRMLWKAQQTYSANWIWSKPQVVPSPVPSTISNKRLRVYIYTNLYLG